jgi:nucleoside-diphosphate-sugar epimerase
MLKVMDKAPPGRGYLMTGDITTVRSLVDRVCRLAGRRPPLLTLPLPVARALMLASSPVFKLRGRRPPIAPEQLQSLSRHWAFDDTRARTELGWAPRTLDEGLPPTVEFLRAAG